MSHVSSTRFYTPNECETWGLILSSVLTYLISRWSRVLLEKLTGSHLVKKLPAFYGNRRFNTAFTRDRHLSLSWTRQIQSILHPHPTFWISILILSSHLRLGFPRCLFRSGFPLKPCTQLFSPTYLLHAPPISFSSTQSILELMLVIFLQTCNMIQAS